MVAYMNNIVMYLLGTLYHCTTSLRHFADLGAPLTTPLLTCCRVARLARCRWTVGPGRTADPARCSACPDGASAPRPLPPPPRSTQSPLRSPNPQSLLDLALGRDCRPCLVRLRPECSPRRCLVDTPTRQRTGLRGCGHDPMHTCLMDGYVPQKDHTIRWQGRSAILCTINHKE